MFHGSCLCAKITYTASELIGPYVYCHCTSCRKSNGTAFAANIAVPITGFKIQSGEEDLAIYESSPKKYRHFCRNCGSPLFTKVGDAPSFVRLRLGTLDSEFKEKHSAHIFVDEQAQWHEILGSVDKYPQWPDSGRIKIPGSMQNDP